MQPFWTAFIRYLGQQLYHCLKFYIYTRDHFPPHVHVVSQDGEAKFLVDNEVVLIENCKMKPKDIKLAESIIEENKDLIINAWIKIHGKD